jgi:hypothetical protein
MTFFQNMNPTLVNLWFKNLLAQIIYASFLSEGIKLKTLNILKQC